ncbi:hypothetical protein SCUP515_09726 [Seiridium cupressi]
MTDQFTNPSNMNWNSPVSQHLSSGTSTSNEEDAQREELATTLEWNTSQCIFCNLTLSEFDANLEYMVKGHGLFIPNRQHLIVDLETLVGYFHLAIFSYCECLYCGSQKASREAVQSHMRDKGHCRFDVAHQDSEFRDFYDLAGSDSGEGRDDNDDIQSDPSKQEAAVQGHPQLLQVDRGFVRLPSGKVLAERSYRAPRASRPVSESSQQQGLPIPSSSPHNEQNSPTLSEGAVTPSEERILSRVDRRGVAVGNQLSDLRQEDRQQLIHLPVHEQRAVLATQKKQLDKQRRTEQWMRSRVERKGNKTLMKHFVNDVPGRSNG